MEKILEQYFVQYNELVLTEIGSLQLSNQPAQWVEETIQSPVAEIIFTEDNKKPSTHFYNFIAEVLAITKDKAVIEFEQFLQKTFENQSSTLSLGNLGYLKKINNTFTWVSFFKSSNYYKDISISPIETLEPNPPSNLISWPWMALILAFIAMVAIVYKSL